MNTNEDFILTRPATARRPLLGLTVLVVEDSRFACEALRLLCLRSGARIRRADSLYSAQQHLKVYRPTVLIVDVGLPDGDGTALMKAMAAANPRIDVILGTSGDTDKEAAVMETGADGFMPKPISSLAGFQSQILSYLPADRQPPGPRLITDELVEPDLVAYHDDLSHVAQVLDGEQGLGTIDYVTQFLGGVARSVQDSELNEAVAELVERRTKGEPLRPSIAQLAAMVQTRLAAAGPL